MIIDNFYKDFKIVDFANYNDYNAAYLIFGSYYTGNVADLPQNTSLQRAYAGRIERGEPMAWGRGMFIYRDGEIING